MSTTNIQNITTKRITEGFKTVRQGVVQVKNFDDLTDMNHWLRDNNKIITVRRTHIVSRPAWLEFFVEYEEVEPTDD